MSVRWQIEMNETSFVTPDGWMYRVTLKTEDGTVGLSAIISKSAGTHEVFEVVRHDNLLLSKKLRRRLITAICRRLWTDLCKNGGDGIIENVDLTALLQEEFGNEGIAILDLIDRSIRTFQLFDEE